MEKNQLHQLLAVENDRRTKAGRIAVEAINTFQKKSEHFDGIVKVYTPYDEEKGAKIPAEIKEVVTTVSDKINYTQKAMIVGIDAQLSKEETNGSGTAKAELKVGEISFGELSATSLLALETQLIKVRDVYKSIPTLDPTKSWEPSKIDGKNIYTSKSDVKYRTEKLHTPLVLSEATKEHPAQVQIISTDKQVGKYETTYKSGKITPTQKSELLGKVDTLIDKVKRARAKANRVEVVKAKVGKKIFDYINGEIL